MTKDATNPTYKSVIDIRRRLEQAEDELPRLAAPDGRVAIPIDALRALMDEFAEMQNMLALGKRAWIERWYGSDPERGSAICIATEFGAHGELLAHFGGDQKTHDAVTKVVSAHNAAVQA